LLDSLVLPLPSEQLRPLGWAAALLCALGAACGAPSTPSGAGPDPLSYLDDASFRRRELVASLVNPANGYSALRLAHYATGDRNDWELLPEWNPPSETLATSELASPGGASTTVLSDRAKALALPASVGSANDPALIALGEAAFFGYPTQLAPYLDAAVTSRAAAGQYGLWVDDARGVGGLVRARMADGSAALAVTCSTCHAAPSGGALVPGLADHDLDLGAAIVAGSIAGSAPPAVALWGAGRVDVTTAQGTEPARIPDLRPARWLTYLQQDATVRANDLATLAIRIETLIITSNEQALRPPRLIPLALAAYVMSLSSALPETETAASASPRGAQVFAAQCASCHVPPALTGPPVPLATVGTDPTLGRSMDRGTGAYRVPSLHGVGTRGPLLHDGTLPSVDAMFDPARTTAAFTARLHGSGAVEGHTFGLDLSAQDRTALIAYLHAL
jgi:cytochrome c5